jgi:hypothetical protein
MTILEPQTNPAPWAEFKTRPERHCLFLLPFLFEPKNNLSLEDDSVSKLLSPIEALFNFLSHNYEVEAVWLESGNHLSREFLEGLPFQVTSISKEKTCDLFIDRSVDLLVANGLEILDLIHNPEIPTLLHLGFLPEPKQLNSAKYQKILFTSPGKADFLLGHSALQMNFIRANLPLFGIRDLKGVLLPENEKSSSLAFSEHEPLADFLDTPTLSPKSQGVIAMLDAEYKRSLDRTRNDLVEQREGQLKWMRKAFTQEISNLLKSNETLGQQLEDLKQNQPQNQDDKITLLKTQCAEFKDLIQELQNKPALEPAPTTNLPPATRVHEMETYIKDLEEQVNRYRNQVHFMFLRWASTFVQTWLIRLPITLAVLTYYIGASYGHRFWLAKRG